jgi:hypothetical protein
MASIENPSRVRRRNKSLKIKALLSSSVPLINRVSKISSPPSSSTAIEVQRIIIHDGFAYFPIVD